MSFKECSFAGCGNRANSTGLCRPHYNQFKKTGEVKEIVPNKSIKNIYKKNKEITFIIVVDYKGETKGKIIVDTEFCNVAKKYTWFITTAGYACANEKGKKILMHRLMMGEQVELFVDHINRNRKDNRKNNLRLVTAKENNWNKACKGFYVQKGKYVARISVNGKTINLGSFKTEKGAIKARKEAEKRFFCFTQEP